MRTATVFSVLSLLCAGILLQPARAEEEKKEVPAETTADAAVPDDENDETKQLLKKLTIAMISEVLDERTVVIRDAAAKGAKKTIHLQLGNIGQVPKGSLDDGEYAEKVKVAKEALVKLVDKQMIWYKAAPENLQAPSSDDGVPDVVIADVWSIDGKHIPTALTKDGHFTKENHYEEELAKDILTAAAEEEKKESYKKLEEALKESEKAKQDARAAQRAEDEITRKKEEDENVEGFGLAGWMGMSVVIVLVLGVATNFGRPGNKKVNLNRKKGFFEKFWMKLKGA